MFLSINFSFSQSTDNYIFKSGERVCFIGNSITSNGGFFHNVFLYYITRFPKQQISFFNCGVSGDIAGGVINRLQNDILVHNPTCAVLMLGMNDVRRNFYSEKVINNKDTLNYRKNAISIYRESVEKIIQILNSEKIRVILQKPSIYDQTASISTPNNLGVNDALRSCGDVIDSLAIKYNIQVIDYWSILNNINKQLQENNPAASIIGNDRVHPGLTGHFIMAYEFLKTQNVPHIVSETTINIKEQKIETDNCTISDLMLDDKIRFKMKENSLPFPITSDEEYGTTLIPFCTELNSQRLIITGLKDSIYRLYIDSLEISYFTSKELNDGINLASFKATPQNQQAIKVKFILSELWNLESIVRSIKFIEYGSDLKHFPYKEEPDKVVAFLKPVFDKKGSSFFNRQLEIYAENKINEIKILSQISKLREKAYEEAQPVNHCLMISPIIK